MARFFVAWSSPGNLSDCADLRGAHLHGVRLNLFRGAHIFLSSQSVIDPYTEQLCNCHIDDDVTRGYFSPHRRKSFVLQEFVRTLRAFAKNGFRVL
jgi:hypothetical protein